MEGDLKFENETLKSRLSELETHVLSFQNMASSSKSFEEERFEFSNYLNHLQNENESNSPKTSELKLRRLDRALVNDEWINTLTDSFAIYRYPGTSDHAPLIIHLAERHNEIKKPFKFFSAWLMDLSIFECVERAWSINSKGNPMFRLSQKLKNTKQAIKIWNQTKFGRVNLIAPAVKQDLDDVQIALASNPTDVHLRSRESSLKERFFKVSRMEESMRRQNARVQWLNLGDSNSAYFYSVMNARRNQNSIGGLLDVHGNLTTDHSQIENIMISYFQNLLNSGTICEKSLLPTPFKILLQEEADWLTRPVPEEEIKVTVFEMDGNRAPGPDGFNGEFYQKFWYIIGVDVVKAIQHFFKNDTLLAEVNSTNITLIPKCSDAATPDLFRPIALCNFAYKIITKIMANRIRHFMNGIISPLQSAFIKGRSIHDNILLTQDVIHNFHLKNAKPAICIKIDLRKAYDKVSHETILVYMTKMGFNEKWCRWVKQCICSPSFAVIFNGSPRGYFKATNGIRQGDPLSPTLFCFIMEILSGILTEAISSGALTSPFSTENLPISHLFYADDVMLFADASVANAIKIKECLDRFKNCTGLEANFNKSEIIFAGCNHRLKGHIRRVLQMNEGALPMKYLGLPLTSGRLTNGDCIPLISKIRGRIASWTNRFLSKAGRVELIKSVLNSFSVYWSSAFRLPMGVLNEIDKIMRIFVWAGSSMANSYHPISWDNVCSPKEEGGLGIRSIYEVSKAFQLKCLWRCLNSKGNPWADWFHWKYVKRKNFWTMKYPSNPSWGARGIFQIRAVAMRYICYSVGNGAGIDFWRQPWHPSGALIQRTFEDPQINSIPLNSTISSLMEDGIWAEHLEYSGGGELNLIINSALTNEADPYPVWKPEPSGKFSLKSAWNFIRILRPKAIWAPSIWFKGHVPKHSFTAWQAVQNRLLTRDRLLFLGNSRETRCLLCNSDIESVNHIFFRCGYSAWIWSSILRRFNQKRKPLNSLPEEEAWIRIHFKGSGQCATAIRIAFGTTIYLIWAERNTRIHGNPSTHKQTILRRIISTIRNRVLFLNLSDEPGHRNLCFATQFKCPLFAVNSSPQFCQWEKPGGDVVKLNSDASMKGDAAGIGGILRDYTGTIRGCFSLNTDLKSIHILEMDAILHGLELARKLNISNIWIESDSLVAVKIMNGSWDCPWRAKSLLNTIIKRLQEFHNWKVSHIWREANQPADYLSKPECPCKGMDIEVMGIPSQLVELVIQDSLGTRYPRLR
ncbi:uncharacterized protein LOC143869152 [Tasmannia lanceolata]|uniref:uncharacterized protein LOC143869152 n=1 Tax=Tasmannia lanceolata TaxID=3420 RepID=UPI0040630D4F